MSNEELKGGPPAQEQPVQPGREAEMDPAPDYTPRYPGSGRLKGRKCLITGADSGIGRAVAVLYAREGADVAFIYLDEDKDAEETVRLCEAEGASVYAQKGDVGEEQVVRDFVETAAQKLGGIDIVVNNAGEQHFETDFENISTEQFDRTLKTNVRGYFLMIREALPHLKEGSAIINTVSVVAYRGSPALVDYSASRAATVGLTRALAKQLASRKIRVNGVAPGPVWTPLIPASFPEDKVEHFGASSQMGRPGQPNEIAPSHLFLACEDSSFMTGQVLHPSGGAVVGG
jgi:NAD(P)-dependent dehydrogenase (short-subunit alcohol dehydrogenase family)